MSQAAASIELPLDSLLVLCMRSSKVQHEAPQMGIDACPHVLRPCTSAEPHEPDALSAVSLTYTNA